MVEILQLAWGMSEQAPEGITAEDWAVTPLPVRVLVRALQQQVRLLHEQVTSLEQRVRVLEEQGRQTSRTSSTPPSSDPPSASPRPPRRACCGTRTIAPWPRDMPRGGCRPRAGALPAIL